MKRLVKAADLDTYFEGNDSQLETLNFPALLRTYCEQRGMLPAHVIERTYEVFLRHFAPVYNWMKISLELMPFKDAGFLAACVTKEERL
ncbi:MAG: hypothetical protein IJ719_13670 [Clostridia bacterium]|nr:hypothetical protein [Clostridia bacterium]